MGTVALPTSGPAYVNRVKQHIIDMVERCLLKEGTPAVAVGASA